MAIATKEEVFQFCGSPDDVILTQGDAVEALIDATESEIESRIGRSLSLYTFTDLVLTKDNSVITGKCIYLCGKLRDIQTATIKEYGDTLAQYTSPSNKGNYIVHQSTGIIERTDSNCWAQNVGDITISGTSQLIDTGEIKQALIEIVGIKAGLWKKTVQTEGGTITTEQSLSKPYSVIDKYKQIDIL